MNNTDGGHHKNHCFCFQKIFIYLFGCIGSQLQHTGSFSWGMWDLVPWPGMEPRLPALGAKVLATGPPRESQNQFFERLLGSRYHVRPFTCISLKYHCTVTWVYLSKQRHREADHLPAVTQIRSGYAWMWTQVYLTSSLCLVSIQPHPSPILFNTEICHMQIFSSESYASNRAENSLLWTCCHSFNSLN